jgi:hypothetical protein
MNSRAKLMSLVKLSLSAPLAGCTTGGQTSLGLTGPASVPYFIDHTVTIDREYMDRYACVSHEVLMCTCDSPRWGQCLCHCQ